MKFQFAKSFPSKSPDFFEGETPTKNFRLLTLDPYLSLMLRRLIEDVFFDLTSPAFGFNYELAFRWLLLNASLSKVLLT